MLFLLLFIQFPQFSQAITIQCIEDANCNLTLKFHDHITAIEKLRRQCRIINSSSCFVRLSLDFQKQEASIIFDRSVYVKGVPVRLDESTSINNISASTLRRYTVCIQGHPEYQISVHIALECQTGDFCTIEALKRYWPRFTSIDRRRNSSSKLFQLLRTNSSPVDSCLTGMTNETETCLQNSTSSCFASINGTRHCVYNHSMHSFDFIYSFNQVDYPHVLSNENISYSLICHSNNCNNNDTIYQISKYSRQFGDYVHSLNYPLYNQSATIDRFHFLFITIFILSNMSFM